MPGDIARSCCRKGAPSAGGSRPEGDRWRCPTCGTEWVHETDESEGSAWFRAAVRHKTASRRLLRTLREWLASWERELAFEVKVGAPLFLRDRRRAEIQGLRTALRIAERWAKKNDPTLEEAKRGAPLGGPMQRLRLRR